MTAIGKYVIITREMSDAELDRDPGAQPFEFLAKLFKKEHGLDFTPKQLEDEAMFHYEEWHTVKGIEAFRITYMGRRK